MEETQTSTQRIISVFLVYVHHIEKQQKFFMNEKFNTIYWKFIFPKAIDEFPSKPHHKKKKLLIFKFEFLIWFDLIFNQIKKTF